MSKQTAIRLPDELSNRLSNLAEHTGRTVSYYMREAITTHIDDLEDIYISEKALEEIRSGKDRVLTSEEFWNAVED